MRALTVLLTIIGVAVSQAPTTCDTVRLNKCITDIFGTYLNISSDQAVISSVFKDYTILNNWFLSQWGRDDGVDTIVYNCNALSNLYNCLGGPQCFSMASLLSDPNVSKEDAYAVRGVLDEYNFNCGAGLGTILTASIKCIQNAISQSQDYLKGCTATYLNNVKHDAPKACTYASALSLCYMVPFHLAECKDETGTDTWWACSGQREFVANQFGQCYNEVQCTIDQNQVSAHLAQHHVKNADGSHTLRLPDTIEKTDKSFKTVPGKQFTIKF